MYMLLKWKISLLLPWPNFNKFFGNFVDNFDRYSEETFGAELKL